MADTTDFSTGRGFAAAMKRGSPTCSTGMARPGPDAEPACVSGGECLWCGQNRWAYAASSKLFQEDAMNEDKTVEILKNAILLEKRGHAFYAKVAQQASAAAVK